MSTINEKVSKLVRPEIRALKAYHVPDAIGLIKLDAMENPYTWPEDIRRAWLKVLHDVELNRYPDPGANAVRSRIRAAWQIPDNLDILLGNGSDELIQIVLMSLSMPGAVVLAPTPTFVMYEMIATVLGLKFVGVPLRPDYSLDVTAMLEAIATHQPAAIFFAYPNNPTCNLFTRDGIERVIEASPGLVVLDEAYYAFARASFIDRLGQYDNLLVMRTLSKQGLAGLRLGMLIGPAPWLEEFNKVRLPYNNGSLAQASADFALSHLELLDQQVEQIREDREKLYESLTRLNGLQVWPSQTNFLLFRTLNRDADEVFESLRARGVLIKNLNAAGGMLQGCLRVTIGTPAETSAFLEALEAAL
ncbi:MAG: histidinol-phosphate transaminase [Sulfuricaulis sp.]|uniref:histidinol-phosphate transaminase n=1 Tax=Sulfuricaulis sp. TaxID=2003553 RepID=UPI0034A40CC9